MQQHYIEEIHYILSPAWLNIRHAKFTTESIISISIIIIFRYSVQAPPRSSEYGETFMNGHL